MDYFQSYHSYFWQWEELQSVISIPGESTIAYTEFVAEAMKTLAPQGLPPFGSLLLAIVATNPRAEQSLDEIRRIIQNKVGAPDEETLEDTMSFLQTLQSLPELYKSGPKRLMAFQTIFYECHYKTAITTSRAMSGKISQGLLSKATPDKQPFSRTIFMRDFRVMALLNDKFPKATSIINGIAGIRRVEEELVLEDNSGNEKPAEELIDQLVENAKTFHVGSLVKRIWSGLNIPVHSSLPSQQPLGGFSDLSNKGDFDKLLLSEFANDDLLFLTRLANNEALYIEREIPPENNKLERVILIDVSLKNWGTPKTIAFATMLAIAKHPKTTINCKVYVIGHHFHSVSIGSVDSIIDGLQIVAGVIHPARGLDAFFKEFPSPQHREVFVITEPSTLKQGEMLKAMYDYQPLINYVIYTDAEGNIDVYKKLQNSKKHIQHLLLPLQSLWQKPALKKAPGTEPKEGKVKPYHDFPILVKSPSNTKKMISTSDGALFQITGYRLLLRFYDKSSKFYAKGWEIVHSNLPVVAGEFEIGVLDDSSYILLIFNPQNKEITLMSLYDNTSISIPFTQWRAKCPTFIFKDGAFLYYTHTSSWRIYPDGRIEKIELLNMNLFHDRKKQLQDLAGMDYSSSDVLKNINTIYINASGRLILNIHELEISQHGYIRFISNTDLKTSRSSTRTLRDSFVFTDGSQIDVNHGGLLCLKSSDHTIPTIYIPTLPAVTLGVATDAAFAGNTYFFKEPLYEVHLQKAGNNKLSLIKNIKAVNNQSLVASKDLVDSGSGLICQYIPEQRALEIKRELEQDDTEVKLVKMHSSGPDQQVLTTKEFYDLYIQRFIDHILSHGA